MGSNVKIVITVTIIIIQEFSCQRIVSVSRPYILLSGVKHEQLVVVGRGLGWSAAHHITGGCSGGVGLVWGAPYPHLPHTMLWWLFRSMMSADGSSSFLMGEGGGVAAFSLGLKRSDT